ncbi:MAG: chemotaxis protein CheW, partial [Lachnoclostridium sp.]|nr:chemotaxis protein CheW [Lachnoclostridium sp.]
MAEEGILLESGTNELELLEFVVGDQSYGINVAKVRELSPYQKPTFVPNSHPGVEGIFMPREDIISVIDLRTVLGIPGRPDDDIEKDMYVITNFNNLHTAFHVQRVLGIHRISWTDISKPEATLTTQGSSMATGIVKIGDKIMIILDFEKIVADINPDITLKTSDIEDMVDVNRRDVPILLAEDSSLLLEMLKKCLMKAGYTHLIATTNGQEAWEKLIQLEKKGPIG